MLLNIGLYYSSVASDSVHSGLVSTGSFKELEVIGLVSVGPVEADSAQVQGSKMLGICWLCRVQASSITSPSPVPCVIIARLAWTQYPLNRSSSDQSSQYHLSFRNVTGSIPSFVCT